MYWLQFEELACDEEYIEETAMTFGERFKEHWKETSPYITTVASLATQSHRTTSK